MFQGDIAQFAPADLLLFLAHMGKEGVLTVRRDDAALSLSFRGPQLVDAASEETDDLVLAAIARQGTATDEAVAYLRRAREETGLPLARILADVDWLPVGGAGTAVAAGVRETVFRLLLWESGSFRFSEIAVEDNPHLAPQDAQALVMDLTREVDEYRELVRGLGPLDRPLRAAGPAPGATDEEAYVLAHAGGAASADALLATAPFPRLASAGAVARGLQRGWLAFAPSGDAPGTQADGADALAAYRRALRRLLRHDDPEARVREVVSFAQAQATQSILLGVRDGRLVRATVYRRDATGRLTARDHRDPPVALDRDPVFRQALAAGRPFVGDAFGSPVLDALDAAVPAAACALLPLGDLDGLDLLLHAVTAEPARPAGPLACLELLSWQVRTPPLERPAAAPAPAPAGPDDPVARMVARIRELPPMPDAVARILALLGDADVDTRELVEALSREPALVARLIKVSNSALYGGGREIGSINQAVVRLGMRTTRSVVVAASTRTLFPMDGSRRGLAGRALWEHAVQTGLAARRVAEFTRRADPDEAFAAGVLHDVGKVIILLNDPDAYDRIRQRVEDGAPDGVAAERAELGFDHGLVGERLLSGWSLPEELCAVARWHHDPAGAGGRVPLVQVVACGDLLSRRHQRGERPDPRLDAVRADLDLDDAAWQDLAELLRQDLEQGGLLD